MTVSQLAGFAAGVLGHTAYRVVGDVVYLRDMKDARKMCLALLKQRFSFAFNGTEISVTIL